ncbi:MAG: DUF222 domain-containing protein [Actinomycetes bacterium]
MDRHPTPSEGTPSYGGTDGGADSAGHWSVPGQTPHNPFVSGAYVVEEAQLVFGQFVARAGDLPTAEKLVEMRRTLDQLEGLWLAASADFSESGELAETGHPTLASWMRARCHLAPAEASARAKVAFAITATQPATGTAVRKGSLSWRHAQVIESVLRQVPADRRDEAEESLVQHAAELDPGQLRRVGDRLVHCFDRDRADEAALRRLERRSLSVAETFDGMVAVNGLLDPVTGALLMTALNTRCRPTPQGADHGDGHTQSDGAKKSASLAADPRSWSQKRVDALGEICSEWLAHINTSTTGGTRPHLSVLVDRATLAAQPPRRSHGAPGSTLEPAQLSWVGPITASEAQMIGCDSTVSRIVLDGPSQVTDVGRATRTIPPALRRAVAARDRTCVGPGCYRTPEHCDVHHIVFWEQGGETSLANTVLLCRHHHRLVHLQHWRVTLDTSGRRTLTPP